MSQTVRHKHRMTTSKSQNAIETGGSGDVIPNEKPKNTASDPDSPRRIKRRRPKHPSIEPPKTPQPSPKLHRPREPPIYVDKEKSSWKSNHVLLSFALVMGLMILMIIIIAIVATFSSDRPFSETTIVTIKTIVRNRTIPAHPSPYNETYWNEIKGDCGEPKQQPNVITSRIVGGIESPPHSWPWLTSIVR